MTQQTIPIDLLLEYLHACAPVVAHVTDQIHPHDPLSTAVMPLVAAITVLERSVRRYQRRGKWNGVPVFLTAGAAEPLETAPASAPKDVLMLVPRWAATSLA